VALVLLWTCLHRPTSQPVPTGSVEPAVASEVPDQWPDAVPSPSVGEAGQTSNTVVVSVVGRVAEPGLVTLASGSRVADAIEAAGGLLPDADPAAVNLAAVVADGQQVAVGVPAAPGAEPQPTPGSGGGLVDLNTADVAQLDALPGIGPVLAQRIVDHRAQQGPFRDVQDLQDVPGIGPTILDRLAGAVTV
jgi:competence protein ComEA